MKGIGSILLYLLAPQRFLVWLGSLGLGMMLLAVPVSLLSDNAAMGLSIYGFIAALAAPFVLSPAILRNLLANVRLVLVPGFKISAGLALLILHVAAVLFIPLCLAQYKGVTVQMPFVMLSFAVASLYSGAAQLLLPSRHLIVFLSTLPLLVMYLFKTFGMALKEWLTMPSTTYMLFVLVLVGWAYAFYRLARQDVFKPTYKAANNEEWLYYGASWLNNQFVGHGSPAGSLLLGYSDSFFSSVMRVMFQVLLSPIVSLVFLYMIGFGEDFSPESGVGQVVNFYAQFFLMFILFSVIAVNQGYGELAARGRFVWLRRGADRQTQWRLLERLLFNSLGMTFIVCAAVAGVLALISNLPGMLLVHFLAITVSISLFSAYFRIFGRMNGWSVLSQHVIVTLACLLLGAGLAVGLALGSWMFLAVIEAGLLLVALLARHGARHNFSAIDWLQVKPKAPPRLRLEGAA